MKKSQIIANNSIKFWNRLRRAQASQPTEEYFHPGFKEFQNYYYDKYIKMEERERERKEKKIKEI